MQAHVFSAELLREFPPIQGVVSLQEGRAGGIPFGARGDFAIRDVMDFIIEDIELTEIVRVLDVVQMVVEILFRLEHGWVVLHDEGVGFQIFLGVK